MKKILALLLMLVLSVSTVTCAVLFADAEETDVEVTVGMKFEWNQNTDTVPQWISNKGHSADGLWSYKVNPSSPIALRWLDKAGSLIGSYSLQTLITMQRSECVTGQKCPLFAMAS